MSQPKVSIIVPVYNAGPYFEKCLDTLVNQTLRDIEIVLVLDCPTDGSDKIAERYATTDERIKLIRNEKNLHVGFSRNVGINAATGKYIGFSDHDDYRELDMYEKLYTKAKEADFDMVRCNRYLQTAGELEKFYYPQVPSNLALLKSHLLDMCLKSVRNTYSIWNWIFKAELIKQNNIKFVDTRKIAAEDTLFLLSTLSYAEKPAVIQDFLYYWVNHPQSASRDAASCYQVISNQIAYREQFINIELEHHHDKDFEKACLEGNAKALYSIFYREWNYRKKRQSAFALIANNKTFVYALSGLFKRSNLSVWSKLKPTVILFVLIVRIRVYTCRIKIRH